MRQGLWKTWKQSQLPQELEGLLPSLDRLPQRKMNYISSDDPVPSSTEDESSSAVLQRALPAFNRAEDNLPPTPTAPVGVQAAKASLTDMALPANALHAVNGFFTSSHVWFPVVERHKIYRIFHQWSDPAAQVSSGDRACLLAIVAYNEVQRHCDLADSTIAIEEDKASRAQRLFAVVRKLIPDEYRKCQLPHIQALLILSLAHLVACLWDDAWLLVGQATRLALLERTTAAHVNTTLDSDMRPDESALARVLAGCFVFDTLISAVAALPSHLRDSDLSGLKPLDEDGIEEWTPLPQAYTDQTGFSGPAYTLSTFNSLLNITKLLSRVSPKAWSSSASLDQLQTVRGELLNSQKTLSFRSRSSQAVIPGIQGQGVLLPHQVTVQLLRLTTLIVVEVRSAGLVFEPSDMSYQILSCLEQITDFLSTHTMGLSAQAIPPIWQLILGTILNEMDRARDLLQIEMPLNFLQALVTVSSTARSRWPCFESLHGRALSGMRRHALLNESPSHAVSQPSQIFVSYAAGAQNAPQSMNVPLDDVPSLNDTAFGDQGHQAVQHNSEGLFDSMETAGMSDTVSSIPDFVTMDALQW